ncbi:MULTISPECIES: TetR/AcrR family transcriptional regulator [Rathayibacter]|jgi:AcrR family transcriptional regulator|uniref:TetR family transcriptional regulator n=1 Tax=Rathayibacter festucae DSM 15932 TaxID=1328866 RepID=A0A3T0T3B1_9MICO|nr:MULTISPECIES: TetR/AcrR family transcriptional regulator [Rathayibacter]AZZ53108.1 TetR family transcriptional regulator [Rathayibacter festucae DSM 15932]MCJ1687027.1 TetR/AcrR family transcriptional regulator [Rathayibacter sp. VKM Ac-2927]
MSTALPSAAPGRRERNKLAKLERITAAASELFAEHGVDDVTTQQIAERADIGTGTLFLYARTKSELLLLVQNAHYAEALERGRAAAADAGTVLDAVLALVAPIVACNRAHVGNGRVYLREMVFGDPAEPHHAEARSIVGRSEEAIAEILERGGVPSASTVAGVVSAVVFVTLAAGDEPDVAAILPAIRAQLAAILPT